MEIAKKILVLITVLTMGACVGFTIARQLGLSSNDWHILYVAEDELMSLEQDRVKKEHLEDRQLFFGQIDKAVNLAVSLPKAYQSGTSKVVYSMGSIKGQNVKSISKEVHQQIIDQLSKQQQVQNNG